MKRRVGSAGDIPQQGGGETKAKRGKSGKGQKI